MDTKCYITCFSTIHYFFVTAFNLKCSSKYILQRAYLDVHPGKKPERVNEKKSEIF